MDKTEQTADRTGSDALIGNNAIYTHYSSTIIMMIYWMYLLLYVSYIHTVPWCLTRSPLLYVHVQVQAAPPRTASRRLDSAIEQASKQVSIAVLLVSAPIITQSL